MDDIKKNKDKANLKITPRDNKREVDGALFDETLKQIEKTLENLGERIDRKQNSQINEKKKQKITNDNEEHIIDNSLLRMEALHDLNESPEPKKQYSLGFYTYLILTMGVIFIIFEVLEASKDLIISKYPMSEPYIEYFYEVIEILTYLVMNIITFIKNLF